MLARLAESYRQVFRFSRSCNSWLGFSAWLVGNALSRVALTWHVYETTGSTQAFGRLAFCYTAPVPTG